MNKKKVLSKLNPLYLDGIAHRGLFDNKSIPENSIKAFENAINHHLPIELDIHLTKDNELVVFHDSDLKRMTSKDGIIEHLTLEELKQYQLPNNENIPLFKDVLELVDEQVPLVIELKVYEKNYKALSKKTIEVLSQYVKDKKNYMLISFDPRSLWPLKKLKIIRSLLVSYDKEYRYVYRFRHTVESVDLDYRFFNEMKYRKYVKRHFVNAWTIQDKETLSFIHPYVDTVTFQYMDEKDVKSVLEYSRSLRKK